VSALASLEPRKLSVLVWHYHDDDVPGPEAAVELSVSGLPLPRGEARLQHYRIDESHSNSYAAWKRMGSPIAPNEQQYAELEAAGQLAAMEPVPAVRVEGGAARVSLVLPRQAVSLLVLEW
ncbi:MAG TPA: beta-xylosidase, partial [Vicinamibacteria bacterium]